MAQPQSSDVVERALAARPAGAGSGGPTRLDLDPFLQLNEEDRDRPLVPQVRQYHPASRQADAHRMCETWDQRIGMRGRRVLEIGCGHGDYAAMLAREYDCEVVGVDIQARPAWSELAHPRLRLEARDISESCAFAPGSFERIVSQTAWEHIRHPYRMLEVCAAVLAPDGRERMRMRELGQCVP